MLKTTLRSAINLAGIAFICVAISIVMHLFTRERITQQISQQEIQLLQQVIPADYSSQELTQRCFMLDSTQYPSIQQVYVTQSSVDKKAYAIKAITTAGYSGKIELLVGITATGKILGVRVISHAETPGLGDKIETSKSDWIYSFNDQQFSMDNAHQWAVKKEGGKFDQFAGATITPRAVINAVSQTAKIVINDFQQINFEQLVRCHKG